MLIIEIGCELNIADESSETFLKDHARTEQAQEIYKIKFSDQFRKNNGPMPVQVENTQTSYVNQTNEVNATDMTNVHSNEQVTATSSGWCDNAPPPPQKKKKKKKRKINKRIEPNVQS